ncbi:MAG TPA: hypothetical protein ENK18_25150 [Deltaproteobacteria bacterium]|nr:hypothetical protein [Deltaproteobacteria bacterium]
MEQGISGLDWRRWAQDRWLWIALGLGLVLRVAPLLLWPQSECIRDECIYRAIANAIIEGEGLTTSSKGWLPAPGYPFLLAWTKQIFGTMQSVKVMQVILSMISVVMLYAIGHLVSGRRTARISALLLALNPTIAWFTNTLWIETIYIFFLLAAGLGILIAQRTSRWMPALWSGVMLGFAVLFRGIATYLPPLYLLAVCWPEQGNPLDLNDWVSSGRKRWRSLAAFGVGLVLTVSPWSIYGSQTYGGFMVSDATVGHVLFLGNNDFPPLTFDYGNGMLTQPLFARYLKTGRRPCKRSEPPVQSSKCEVQQALRWIQTHPGRFIGRIPMRLAQIFNPNSFLTRHVRWGYLPGLPWFLKEALCVLIVTWTTALYVGGTLAAWGRARGPWAYVAVGTTIYTLAITAIMYGMTRFRLPLEALWTVYLALFLANPRATFDALRDSPARLTGALITIPPVLALMLWYLPTGFPMFWR